MEELNKNILFAITKEVLQKEAIKRIDRELTEQELFTASKGIQEGLSFDIDTVFTAAIEDAVEMYGND